MDGSAKAAEAAQRQVQLIQRALPEVKKAGDLVALKDVANALGTGPYVAQVTSGVLPPVFFLPLVFLVSAGIAFSTGTSWGTFGIMLPIAVPAARAEATPEPAAAEAA